MSDNNILFRNTGVSMIKLSVNINKIATLRNARGEEQPSVAAFATASINYGAHGITVHPRPDERHIRYTDVIELSQLILSPIEFNIEGYPDQRYQDIIARVKPDQATLVPDSPEVITSNAGWDVIKHKQFLTDTIKDLKKYASRVSLFIDPNLQQIEAAKAVGADRIELYTKSFADAFQLGHVEPIWSQFYEAAAFATKIGLGVNAGHDLNLANLTLLRQLPGLMEVSIGHALVCDALWMGWENTIKAYLQRLTETKN